MIQVIKKSFIVVALMLVVMPAWSDTETPIEVNEDFFDITKRKIELELYMTDGKEHSQARKALDIVQFHGLQKKGKLPVSFLLELYVLRGEELPVESRPDHPEFYGSDPENPDLSKQKRFLQFVWRLDFRPQYKVLIAKYYSQWVEVSREGKNADDAGVWRVIDGWVRDRMMAKEAFRILKGSGVVFGTIDDFTKRRSDEVLYYDFALTARGLVAELLDAKNDRHRNRYLSVEYDKETKLLNVWFFGDCWKDSTDPELNLTQELLNTKNSEQGYLTLKEPATYEKHSGEGTATIVFLEKDETVDEER